MWSQFFNCLLLCHIFCMYVFCPNYKGLIRKIILQYGILDDIQEEVLKMEIQNLGRKSKTRVIPHLSKIEDCLPIFKEMIFENFPEFYYNS